MLLIGRYRKMVIRGDRSACSVPDLVAFEHVARESMCGADISPSVKPVVAMHDE